jgi:predicted phage replisome organizer
MEKKYYWLKLKSDFFSSKRIKKLRKMAGGDTYTIIYLKMQLLALKTDGVLQWTGVEDDFAAELALDLDETTEDVEMTLIFLKQHGLIETTDEINFFLPYVIENTGSEGSSAERVRAFRERERVKLLQCNDTETTCNTEIEKEKEKKTDIEKDIYKAFAGDDLELFNALKEHETMRKRIKKPIEDGAKNRLLTKLQKFPREQWIPILNCSTDNCWLGIYPLDEKKQTVKQVDRKFVPTDF